MAARSGEENVEQLTVGEIVRGRPVYLVQEDDSVLDAARYMTEYRAGAVPVLSGETLVGLLAERDLMTRVVAPGLDPASTRVGQVMTTKVAVLSAESTCQEAIAIMQRLGVHYLPVVARERLLGCVSLQELQQTAGAGTQEIEVEFVDSYAEKARKRKMDQSHPSLADQVRAIPGGEHLYMCYSCGTCVGSCMMQKVELTYNPRRLIQKVIHGLEQEAFEDKTSWLCSACDLCYPACPQKIHVSGVLQAVRELAAQAGYTTPLEVAVVNEWTCTACGLCTQVCPYEAATLVDRRIMGQTRTVAQVDPNRCMACGVCAASCRSASIELQSRFSNQALMDDLWAWIDETQAVPSPVPAVEEWPHVVPAPVEEKAE
jgi:heterodisulfide reductase subunit C/CBS domain-containing protein